MNNNIKVMNRYTDITKRKFIALRWISYRTQGGKNGIREIVQEVIMDG